MSKPKLTDLYRVAKCARQWNEARSDAGRAALNAAGMSHVPLTGDLLDSIISCSGEILPARKCGGGESEMAREQLQRWAHFNADKFSEVVHAPFLPLS